VADTLQTLYDKQRTRRVRIIRRADGTFSFLEEHWSSDSLEQVWIPQTSKRSLPLCDSAETALREAQGRISWLADRTGDA